MARTGMLRLHCSIRVGMLVMAALALLSSAALCALESPQSIKGLGEEDVLLVIAPHPDDEVISSMGLMLQAKRTGAEVHVLYLTNGEHPVTSAVANRDRDRDEGNAFIALGYARQRESTSVMSSLGVDSVSFLGYPDSCLYEMTGPGHWLGTGLLSSRTKLASVPYVGSPAFGKLNTGSNLLEDITIALRAIRPSIIVLPSTFDAHQDHCTAGIISQIAVESCRYASVGLYVPQLMSYLVHVRDIGWNNGYRSQEERMPFSWMEDNGNSWLSFSLLRQDVIRKRTAVLTFSTQGAALNTTLLSSIRPNEIFCAVEPVAHASASGIIEEALPSGETFERSAHPAADIAGFNIDSSAEGIRFTAKLASPASSRYTYVLRAYFADDAGSIVDVAEVSARGDLGRIIVSSSHSGLRADEVQVAIIGNSLVFHLPRAGMSAENAWLMMHTTYSIGEVVLDRGPVVKIRTEQ